MLAGGRLAEVRSSRRGRPSRRPRRHGPTTLGLPCNPPTGHRSSTTPRTRRSLSACLDRSQKFGQGILGVTKKKDRLRVVEQSIVYAREPGSHAALQEHDIRCPVDVQDRHPVYRAAGVVPGSGVYDVVGADDQGDVGARELVVRLCPFPSGLHKARSPRQAGRSYGLASSQPPGGSHKRPRHRAPREHVPARPQRAALAPQPSHSPGR